MRGAFPSLGWGGPGLWLLMWCLFGPSLSHATELTAEARGFAVAEALDQADAGYGDMRAEVTMVIEERDGNELRRQLSIQMLEVTDDGDKNLSIVRAPRDVAGTALLSHARKVGNDDQWLLLPAVGRVKRISSSNRAGPFMGSEFAFEDMTAQELEKFSYRYLAEDWLDGRRQHQVERTPVYDGSGYRRQVMWVDADELRISKLEFFDRNDRLVKTLNFEGYKRYLDRHWRPDVMVMVNHQNGRSTRLYWQQYQFQNGLTDADFTVNALRRAR